jgi:hypothetical protein
VLGLSLSRVHSPKLHRCCRLSTHALCTRHDKQRPWVAGPHPSNPICFRFKHEARPKMPCSTQKPTPLCLFEAGLSNGSNTQATVAPLICLPFHLPGSPSEVSSSRNTDSHSQLAKLYKMRVGSLYAAAAAWTSAPRARRAHRNLHSAWLIRRRSKIEDAKLHRDDPLPGTWVLGPHLPSTCNERAIANSNSSSRKAVSWNPGVRTVFLSSLQMEELEYNPVPSCRYHKLKSCNPLFSQPQVTARRLAFC